MKLLWVIAAIEKLEDIRLDIITRFLPEKNNKAYWGQRGIKLYQVKKSFYFLQRI